MLMTRSLRISGPLYLSGANCLDYKDHFLSNRGPSLYLLKGETVAYCLSGNVNISNWKIQGNREEKKNGGKNQDDIELNLQLRIKRSLTQEREVD